MSWTTETTGRVTYTEWRGDYKLTVIHWRYDDGIGEVFTWKVAAQGKPGANGKAIDLEDGKRRAVRAYELVLELASLQELPTYAPAEKESV